MKKLLLSFATLLLVAFLTACGGSSEAQDEDVSANNEEQENDTEETEGSNEEASYVGVGSNLTDFEAKYGPNEGDDNSGRFDNDYILAIFSEDKKAMNLTVQFEATENPSHTMDEALAISKEFIPNDAEFVKEYDETLNEMFSRKVIEYYSPSLEESFPDWEPAGTFIVIANHGTNNPNDVFSLVIGLGDNP